MDVMVGHWGTVGAGRGAKNGARSGVWGPRARAAFVTLAGSREAAFLEKKSTRKGQPRVVRAKTPVVRECLSERGRARKYMKPMWSHRVAAVLAGMMRRSPVFSATPSIVIMLDS